MSEKGNKTMSFIAKQRNMIIALTIIFAVLLAGYFIIIAPLMKEDAEENQPAAELEALPGEVIVGNRIYVYERLEKADIDSVVFHNPQNSSYGEKYVDWSFSIKIEENKATNTKDVNFYLDGYEYAPTDATKETLVISAVSSMLVSSRVEEHAQDLEKYGLEKADGKHDDECIYYVLKTRENKEYKVYIGDKTPSGTGYYVKSGDTVKDESGREYVRDSVYVVMSTTIENAALSNPMNVVEPLLTYPIQPSGEALFDSFALSERDGSLDILFQPVSASKKNPFSLFAALSIYESLSPSGYYGSIEFDSLSEDFANMSGHSVVELASLQKQTDELTGEEYEDYAFSEEVLKKYGLTEPRYSLYFSNTGFDSAVFFSDIQKDGFYYAYAVVYNTIVRVDPAVVHFLEWEESKFLQSEVFQMRIDDCAKIEVSGVLNDEKIHEIFHLTGDGDKLSVKCESSGNIKNISNFRNYYTVLLQTCTQDEVPLSLDIEKLMEGEPVLSFAVTTEEKIVYKKDEEGGTTAKLDYVLEPVTRIFRFYQYSNGRALCTIESIDSEGVSSGEVGNFYLRMFKIEKILSDTLKVRDGIEVDRRERY